MNKDKISKIHAIRSVILLFLRGIALYFKVVILGKKQVDGYVFKEIGNLPIVGCYYYEGYELLNSKTNKVLYRKVKDWGYVGNLLNRDRYTVVSKFFFRNVI